MAPYRFATRVGRVRKNVSTLSKYFFSIEKQQFSVDVSQEFYFKSPKIVFYLINRWHEYFCMLVKNFLFGMMDFCSILLFTYLLHFSLFGWITKINLNNCLFYFFMRISIHFHLNATWIKWPQILIFINFLKIKKNVYYENQFRHW